MENNELMVNEEFMEDAVVNCEAYVEPVNGMPVGVKIGLAVGVIGAVGTLLYKSRHKFEQWNIKRLMKKGYVVYKYDDMEDVDEVSAKDID